jgi:hypothetical protein
MGGLFTTDVAGLSAEEIHRFRHTQFSPPICFLWKPENLASRWIVRFAAFRACDNMFIYRITALDARVSQSVHFFTLGRTSIFLFSQTLP